MYTTIQKQGNNQAMRVPKAILEMTKLKGNDKVEIKIQGGNLVIVPIKKHKTLAARVAEYKGDYTCNEWETGKPRYKEVF